jgi:putative DNA primase/helicase
MIGLEFLKIHNILWFPVNVKVIDGEKHFLPYDEEGVRPNYSKDFNNLELIKKRQAYTGYDTIAIDTHIVQQIDIDSEEAHEMYKSDAPCYKSVRKGLPHYFFKLKNNTEHKPRFKVLDIHKDIDVLNGQFSFASRDFVVENSENEIQEFIIPHPDDTHKHNDKTLIKTDSIDELLDIIDVEYIDDYESWYRIGASLYNCGYPVEVFDNFSKRSKNYGGVDKLWRQYERQELDQIGFGTLCYYAKESNVSNWEKFKHKLWNDDQKSQIEKFLQSGSFLSHSTASKIFYEAFKDKYVYSNGAWYELTDGGIYKKLVKDATTIISKDLKNYMQKFILNIIETTDDENQRKALWKANSSLENHSFKGSCVDEAKQDFIDRTLLEQLNSNTKLIGFTNGIYDLENHVFRKGTIKDKVSMTTKYEYNAEIKTENQEFLENLFDNYFETKETSYYFKKLLGSILEGGNDMEKVWFWVGQGRNGKGTTDQMLRNCLGDYYTTLNNSYFTLADKHSNQAHPEIIKLKNTRISMTHEPEGTTKYLTSKFKSLSGGDPLEARELYSNDLENFIPTFKPFIQTNHLPQFTDVDTGLLQRIVVIKFPFMFLDENNYDYTNKYHKKADFNLKNKLKNINMDFFHFLVKYYKLYKSEGLAITKEIDSSINEYRKDIDSVKTFIDEAIVKTTNDKDRISTTDLLYHHNTWSSNKTDRERFAKRLKCMGYELKQKKIDGKKVMCISFVKWNNDFKNEIEECMIKDDF